jgi:DHA1 family multidrug resistance protein-like MFS transporter
MTVFAPIWGILADRYGRKLMVLRSMFGGAVVLALMAFARNVSDLLVLRLLQGALTGTVTASVALVASVAPVNRSGYALGMMQAAVFGGASIGPLLGGAMADKLGFRPPFFVAAAVLLIGGLLVRFGVQEQVGSQPVVRERKRGSFAEVIGATGFIVATFALFQIQFANTAVSPVFVLFVEKLNGTPLGVATITGGIMSVAGIAAAFSAGMFGRFGDAWGHKRLLVVSTLFAGLITLPQAFARDVGQLFVLRVLLGLAAAGIMPSANAIIRSITVEENVGTAFGLVSSASCLGTALGPLAGGYLAASMGLPAPFVLTGMVLVLTSFLVTWGVKPERNGVADVA